jgi:hypothetical protein
MEAVASVVMNRLGHEGFPTPKRSREEHSTFNYGIEPGAHCISITGT